MKIHAGARSSASSSFVTADDIVASCPVVGNGDVTHNLTTAIMIAPPAVFIRLADFSCGASLDLVAIKLMKMTMISR